MARGNKACDECSTNCVTLHQNQKDPSPLVTRFFKIMRAKNYDKFMHLPPEFARSVRHLAGKQTQIEDSLGRKCIVKCSYVGGSLAFQEGWPEFFQDHDLEFGELLTFHYIKGGHFIVHVYKMSACEKTNFYKRRGQRNKRSRKNSYTVSEDQPYQIIDVNSMDVPRSNAPIASESKQLNNQNHLMETNVSSHGTEIVAVQNLPTSMEVDDLSFMLNRDAQFYQGEECNFLYDLSSFEMETNTSDADKIEKTLDGNITPVLVPIRKQALEGDDPPKPVIHTNPVDGHSAEILTNNIQTQPSDDSNSKNDTSHNVSKFENDERRGTVPVDTGSPSKVGSSVSSSVPKDPLGRQPATMKEDHGVEAYGFRQVSHGTREKQSKGYNSRQQDAEKVPVIGRKRGHMSAPAVKVELDSSHSKVPPVLKDPLGKQPATMKEDHAELGVEAYGFRQVSHGTRGKQSKGYYTRQQNADKVPVIGRIRGYMSAPAVKVELDSSHSKVPLVAACGFTVKVQSQSYLELPVRIPSIPGKREFQQRKVVYLRDPTGRVWPLLYHDKIIFKVLTDNWRRFCEANNIMPGDTCRFQVENCMLCSYTVDIVHKSGQVPDN